MQQSILCHILIFYPSHKEILINKDKSRQPAGTFSANRRFERKKTLKTSATCISPQFQYTTNHTLLSWPPLKPAQLFHFLHKRQIESCQEYFRNCTSQLKRQTTKDLLGKKWIFESLPLHVFKNMFYWELSFHFFSHQTLLKMQVIDITHTIKTLDVM